MKYSNSRWNEKFKKGYRSRDVGLNERLTLINEMKESYSINFLCQVFDVHRSNYRYWLVSSLTIRVQDLRADAEVKAAYELSSGSARSRTLAALVTSHG